MQKKAVGIDVKFPVLPFFSVAIFLTRLEINEILSTRLLNSNTRK